MQYTTVIACMYYRYWVMKVLTCRFIHPHLQGYTITHRQRMIFQTVKPEINFYISMIF